MYLLKINNGKEWLDADLGSDASVASTYEEAGIAEMSIKGSGTQSITLPLTPQNAKIFGYISASQVYSRIPRKRLDCRLYNDGLELFGAGSYCVLLTTDKQGYHISVLGGSCNVFSTLQNVVFDDYPDVLGSAHRWSVNYQPLVIDDGIRYLSTYGSLGNELPAVPLTYIKSKLESATGLTLPADIFKDGYFVNLLGFKKASDNDDLVAFDSMAKQRGEYSVDASAGRQYDQEQYITPQIRLPKKLTALGLQVLLICKYNETSYTTQTFQFVLNYNSVNYFLECKFNGRLSANGFKKGTFVIDGVGGNYYYNYVTFMNDGTIVDMNGRNVQGIGFTLAEIPDATQLRWGWDNYQYQSVTAQFGRYYPVLPLSCVEVRMQPMIKSDEDEAQAYGDISIAKNIGFKNALELYKALAQTFALITHGDGSTAVTYNMSDVVSAKASAVNWTEKVVSLENTYAANEYARINHYKFKDDGTIVVDKIITSDDETLQESKSTEIAFLAGNTTYGMQLWEEQEDGAFKLKKVSNPYLLKWDSYWNRFVFATDDDMNGYDIMQEMLQTWLQVHAEVVLSVTDILKFDHRVPIYLEQYGRYFYCQKIENYQSGKTCKVTLYALP